MCLGLIGSKLFSLVKTAVFGATKTLITSITDYMVGVLEGSDLPILNFIGNTLRKANFGSIEKAQTFKEAISIGKVLVNGCLATFYGMLK